MNDQTTHDLKEAICELNESIRSNVAFFIRDDGSWIGDPLTTSDLEEVLQDLSKDIQLNPDNAVLYINRGTVYSYIGDYDRAISDHDAAIRINPEYAKAYLDRGNLYFHKEIYDRAISDYDVAIRINPEYAEVYYGRSEVYDRLDKPDQANTDAEKAIKLGLTQQGYIENCAFEIIEDLVQICPRNAKLHYYRGLVLHNYWEDSNLAIEAYNETIRLDPKCAEAYHERAGVYYDMVNYDAGYDKVIANYDKVIMDYDKAQRLGYGYRGPPELGLIGITDSTIKIFLAKGEIYAEKGDYDSAIADMSEVIARADSFNDLYDEFVLRIREDVYLGGDSFSSDRTSVHFGSDPSARAYNNRGFYYHKKGEEDLAVADLKEALRLYNEQLELDPASNPDFATIYLNLGNVYHAKQDYDMAVENYDNVVRLCPNYKTDFIESKFAHGGQNAVEIAIKLLGSRVNTRLQNAEGFYYAGVQDLFYDNGLSAKRWFKSALRSGYGNREKIEKHLENLKDRK